MWPYEVKKIMDLMNQPWDMINSPFAFPKLPPHITPPMGISNAGKIKDQMVNDSESMMSRLSAHHVMFQRYASSLFNMTQNRFVPGHPLQSRISTVDLLQENEKLKRENISLKADISKEKKK